MSESKIVGVVYKFWMAHGLTCLLLFSQLPKETNFLSSLPCATRKQKHKNPTINVLTWLHQFKCATLFSLHFQPLPSLQVLLPHFKSTSSSYTPTTLFLSPFFWKYIFYICKIMFCYMSQQSNCFIKFMFDL
jgi:hypothetical protein